MKKTVLIIFFAIISQLIIAQDYESSISKARYLIQQHQEQTQTPGVQVAMIIEDSLVWSECFGYSNIHKKTEVTRTTKFRIASLSKPVTSVALARMMERNEIDIDRNIRHYLPEFPEKEFTITSRHLASSTSGIRHYTEKDPATNSTHYPNVLASLERFKHDELLFEPGSEYLYSSYGWVLLSAVMEKASGSTFFELMEETWNDLGMDHTGFDYPDKQNRNVSEFYVHHKRHDRVKAPQDNRSFMYAGGGYLSTAEDLVNMGNALLQGEYLNPGTVNRLFESQKLNDGTNTHYGLGWETGRSRTETSIVYHTGNMSSARSHLIIYPEEEIVFAYLSNTGDHIFFNEREAQNIAEIFIREKSRSGDREKSVDSMVGEWKVSTTSLRDRKSRGKLVLKKDEEGFLKGHITFKRSRKKKSFPLILAESANDTIHLIAVTPMFLDMFISVGENKFQGYWLHDFNVKGIPEEDPYWVPRDIVGEKVEP